MVICDSFATQNLYPDNRFAAFGQEPPTVYRYVRMRIAHDKIDEATLNRIGQDVVHLLCAGDVDDLAARFGYAIALGRDPATAIREDLAGCLGQIGAFSLVRDSMFDFDVKFFTPNSSNLLAVIECAIPVLNGRHFLIEVIVSSDGYSAHATLEQISVTN